MALLFISATAIGLAAIQGTPPSHVEVSACLLGIAAVVICGLLVLQIVLTVKDLCLEFRMVNRESAGKPGTP